ncbi:PPK2 family polyphosphate kinase [Arenicella xantha]|uniref:Polyphosphate:AMP phosphotransferase n=1 Tax=Arenicella xantha TaxID=644221 RepID=A0A395JGT4_9GAMM|nr:PPK2 family polyphosphate kinase [Arenicella xantha]RBP48602.1 polyphosphate:AMP phosphotransferase [Arenicella xantha]
MDFDQFRVATPTSFELAKLPTDYDGGVKDDDLKELREELWLELAEWQERLYAENKQSLLVVFQAMDAAGKDSSIGKLTSALSAHGCHVKSFKKPSTLEAGHDFLWRIHAAAPKSGEMTMFNRSHYEDVLIVKVHQWADAETIERRYDHINNFERLLADRGTKVVKFMLNISKDYQLERFQRRLENPDKHWKFNPGDLDERAKWSDYMHAFESAIGRCSSDEAPWYIVPAENRKYRDVMIASVLRDTLKAMDPQYPEPDFDPTVYTVDSIS